MATNHTTNYGLNLWEPTDKFLRTEFNENSEKIDAALKAHDTRMTALDNKSRFTKIGSGSFATSSEISLASIDWSAWDKVHIDMVTNNGTQAVMYFNALGSADTYIFAVDSSSGNNYQPRLTFYPCYQATRNIVATYGGKTAYQSNTFQTLKKLVFSGSWRTTATYTIWGEK